MELRLDDKFYPLEWQFRFASDIKFHIRIMYGGAAIGKSFVANHMAHLFMHKYSSSRGFIYSSESSNGRVEVDNALFDYKFKGQTSSLLYPNGSELRYYRKSRFSRDDIHWANQAETIFVVWDSLCRLDEKYDLEKFLLLFGGNKQKVRLLMPMFDEDKFPDSVAPLMNSNLLDIRYIKGVSNPHVDEDHMRRVKEHYKSQLP